jgi:raffinose/stachyose/melibiose transport system permease protein
LADHLPERETSLDQTRRIEIKKRSEPKAKWDHPALVIFFVAPVFMLVLVFIAYPAGRAVYDSLYRWQGLSGARTFVGLENWRRLFSDPVILGCIWRNLALAAVSVFIEIPLAFAIALVLARARVFGRNLYRTAYFFPVVFPVTVAGVLWSWVYNPRYGLLNEGLRAVGLDQLAKPWLSDSNLVMPAVLLVIVWKLTGFYIVIFMAALESIPQDIYDVAALDGTNLWQLGVHVLVPMLREVITVNIAIAITASIKRFDLIYVMTGGGPVHDSELLATYMFRQAFLSYDMGYASTIAFFLFLLTLALVVVQIQSMRSEEVVEF